MRWSISVADVWYSEGCRQPSQNHSPKPLSSRQGTAGLQQKKQNPRQSDNGNVVTSLSCIRTSDDARD
jgi:hypothetical protein